MLGGSNFSDNFGGYVAPDPLVRTAIVNGKEYKIRKADRGLPYTESICHLNQSVVLKGDFLLDFSDAKLIERIEEEISLLKKREQEYQNTLNSDVALLRSVCASVGIEVDNYVGGNFNYFLTKYLRAKGLDWDVYSSKLNGENYKIIYNGSHHLTNFKKLVEAELNKPSFDDLLVEFRALLKKPQTPNIKKKTNELRDLLYKQGTKAELKSAGLI